MYNTIYLDMPATIKAFLKQSSDGALTIVINSRLNIEQNIEGFLHEIEHINGEDYQKMIADAVELIAHAT